MKKTDIYKLMKENPSLFYEPMPQEIKEKFPVITMDILDKMGLHFTTKHNGKMSGMYSLSTSCKCNYHCIERIRQAYKILNIEIGNKESIKKYLKENPLAENISICAFCFSDSQQDYMTSMITPLARNHEILKNGIIHSDWLPIINALYFRIESFGDFDNENQVINVYNICKKNPLVHFTGWTKNLVYLYRVDNQGIAKPNNFRLVYSSQFINRVANVPKSCRHLVNLVFTVYTKEYTKKHEITINCGANACLTCLRCYTGENIYYINELLK